jgi:hypothetical protein
MCIYHLNIVKFLRVDSPQRKETSRRYSRFSEFRARNNPREPFAGSGARSQLKVNKRRCLDAKMCYIIL